MLAKTSGIVLRTVKYSDKASIITIYTSDYGRISYMAYGIYGKKSGNKSANFLPLSLIEITANYVQNKDIQTIKETKIIENLVGIHSHPLKSAIALFIAELLYKSLNHPESEIELFRFLQKAIVFLNNTQEPIANFHLVFAMQLCKYLGIQPNGDKENPQYFDMQHGEFVVHPPQHKHVLHPSLMQKFIQLLQLNYENANALQLNRKMRQELLEAILEYYKLHIPGFHGLNSLEVLQEIFN